MIIRGLIILPVKKYIFGFRDFTAALANVSGKDLLNEFQSNEELRSFLKPYKRFFENYDILNFTNGSVKTGIALDKLHRYITSLKNSNEQFIADFSMIYVMLNIQIVILYNWYDFSFTTPFFIVFTICLIISLSFGLITLFALVIVDDKHETITFILDNISEIIDRLQSNYEHSTDKELINQSGNTRDSHNQKNK